MTSNPSQSPNTQVLMAAANNGSNPSHSPNTQVLKAIGLGKTYNAYVVVGDDFSLSGFYVPDLGKRCVVTIQDQRTQYPARITIQKGASLAGQQKLNFKSELQDGSDGKYILGITITAPGSLLPFAT
ncbi:hypothetical protein FRC09_014494, partial [Ceratobasidium sp. 395]